MGVPQDHIQVRVAKQIAYGIEVNPGLNQSARKLMAEVMEAEIIELCALDELAPRGIDPGQLGSGGAWKDGILGAHIAPVLLPSA